MTMKPKSHVASGSYAIHNKKPLVIEALLGTCVGVALYDKVAEVGGLIHLLLPEPVSPGRPAQPEKYATSGIPMILERLYEAGAEPENLRAVIAGGALVGPVNHQDMALDIGGRTAEAVKTILAQENIQIETSETGGFFTCCLSLDLQTFQTSIVPTDEKFKPETEDIDIPDLEKIENTLENLQPIPQVALKILRLLQEDSYNIYEISEEIKKDQVISAKTLQLCNSAMFAGKIRISTLNDAILLLGQSMIINIVITACVKNYYNQSESGYSLCKGGLFHHAVGTAIISERIALKTGKASSSLAYTAGLLHDIGKVVLDQFITPAYPRFYRKLNQKGSDTSEIEKEIFGINHCETGMDLAEKWNFPDSLQDVVCFHHNPDLSRKNRDLVNIVYLADLLMTYFHPGLEMEKISTVNLSRHMTEAGLSITEFADIADMIPTREFSSALDTL